MSALHDALSQYLTVRRALDSILPPLGLAYRVDGEFIRVFARERDTRIFDINWPNSCSLRHDGRDLIIPRLLADSGIEPREPAKDDSAAP